MILILNSLKAIAPIKNAKNLRTSCSIPFFSNQKFRTELASPIPLPSKMLNKRVEFINKKLRRNTKTRFNNHACLKCHKIKTMRRMRGLLEVNNK